VFIGESAHELEFLTVPVWPSRGSKAFPLAPLGGLIEGFFYFRKGETDMDIREERYSDFIAMLLVSILLLGLTLFELAILLSRNSQG
jgi:hypothetical protein